MYGYIAKKNDMLLKNKNAVVYGAGGSLGGAVSKALAAAGARVFLTGRASGSIDGIKAEILAAGGQAETAIVDGFDPEAIAAHLETVVQSAATVDISFNAVDVAVVQNIPLIDIPVEDIVGPVTRTMQTRSLTALAAVECFSRNLAAELGIYGIRVVNIRSGGSPDSRVFKHAIDHFPDVMKGVLREMKADTMLKRLPLMADIANTAVFLASDFAGMITGVTVDVTGGTTAGLNYRMAAADNLQVLPSDPR